MTLNDTLKFDGKKYKHTGKSGCGAGELYVFREIFHENGSERLSDECKIFQVYRNNGSEIEIIPFNDSAHLIPYLKELLEAKVI
jgi:hypothetical protein